MARLKRFANIRGAAIPGLKRFFGRRPQISTNCDKVSEPKKIDFGIDGEGEATQSPLSALEIPFSTKLYKTLQNRPTCRVEKKLILILTDKAK